MARRTQVIVPTAINVIALVNESVITARKAGDPVAVVLPSLRQRAKLIVNEEGALRVDVSVPTIDPANYTR